MYTCNAWPSQLILSLLHPRVTFPLPKHHIEEKDTLSPIKTPTPKFLHNARFTFRYSLSAFHFQIIDSHTMASQGELKQRLRNDSDISDVKKSSSTNVRTRRDKKMAMAKRGLRSLVIAAALPLSLSLLSGYLASSYSTHGHDAGTVTSRKPFWFPPTWALHLTCPASSLLMGLSAWLVWADGGFHRNPTALELYLAQLALTLLWDPIVFGAGATRVGLTVCLGILGTQVGCLRVFKRMNPIASDLVKPCLAWTAFLCVVNLKLVFV